MCAKRFVACWLPVFDRKGSGSHRDVCPRPCSSTCQRARCATHQHMCFRARVNRVSVALCIKASGIGAFHQLARVTGLVIEAPHLSAFGFKYHCGIGPTLLCAFLHSLARRWSHCQAVLERVKRQRKGSVGQTERLEMKEVICKA